VKIKRRHIAMARAASRCYSRHAAALNEHGRYKNPFRYGGWQLITRWHRAANHKGPKS